MKKDEQFLNRVITVNNLDASICPECLLLTLMPHPENSMLLKCNFCGLSGSEEDIIKLNKERKEKHD
jgi:hypothetical protein